MKQVRLILITTAVAVLLVASTLVAAAQSGATAAVNAADFEFQDKTITIEQGTTVTWTNTGEFPHTVTAPDQSFDSGQFAPDATFNLTFDTVGTIPYYCTLHGTAEGGGMAGSIVVVAAAQPEPTAEPTAEPAPEEPTPAPVDEDSGDEEMEEEDEGAAPETMPETGGSATSFGWLVTLLGVAALAGTWLLRRRTI